MQEKIMSKKLTKSLLVM